MPEPTSEYPKVTDWDDGNGPGISVAYDDAPGQVRNYVRARNYRALHAVLTEKIAEQDAKRWVAREYLNNTFLVESPRYPRRSTSFWFGTPEQNKADAEEYAAKLNAREGLA